MKPLQHYVRKKQINIRTPAWSVFLLLLIHFVFFTGCVHYVSYYNAITYKNLADLKGEMGVAFEIFSLEGASGENDLNTLEGFRIKIAQAREYESGKKLNDNTIAQFKILDENIREIIDRFKENANQLSAGYCKAKWMILESAFDIAITTERGKIEKKQ